MAQELLLAVAERDAVLELQRRGREADQDQASAQREAAQGLVPHRWHAGHVEG